MTDAIKTVGFVNAVIEYDTGEKEFKAYNNAVLTTGREALASCLANDIGDSFDFYINRMLFGDGGTSGGNTKFVSTSRNGLFGITQVSKPVIASIDPNIPSQVVFTSVIARSEGNGAVLSEMALQLATGDLYSMVTFPDLTKTAQMQITFNWRINFI